MTPAIYTPWQKTMLFSSVTAHAMLQAARAATASQRESLVISPPAEFPKGCLLLPAIELLQQELQLMKTLQQISCCK